MLNGGSMPLRSPHIVAAALCSCLLLWFAFSAGRRPVTATSISKVSDEEQPYYELPIKGHVLGHDVINLTESKIQVSRIQIEVSQIDMAPLPLLQPLDVKLPPPADLTVGNETDPPLPDATVVRLNIPRLPHTRPDASHFIFGVSTTYERLEESLDTMSHWLSNSKARLIGHMAPSLDLDAPDRVLRKAESLKITLGTIESRYEFLDRYFGLLKVLHQNRQPNTKWYVFIDDDTFFLSMANLVETFAKFDASLPWYVGALTEDFTQMANWGYFAYGGGGIFLSHALVEALLPHYDQCFKHMDTGDRMLAECIYRQTTTKFTWEPRLHQLDLHGDQSGFYEALRPQPLSLHHWKSDHFRSTIDMYNLSQVARICGDSCLLQKFVLADDWVLTNGFSLVRHSNYDTRHRPDWKTDASMERTWDFYYDGTRDAHFEHSLGPIRPPDTHKLSYRMESAVVEGARDTVDRSVRQLYVKRKGVGDEKNHGPVEAVVEVIWRFA